MKRLCTCAAIIVLSCMLAGVAGAEDVTVFHQDYTTMSAVPANMVVAYESAPYTSNFTLGYSPATHSVNTSMVYGNVGNLYVANFTPSPETNFSITMDMDRSDSNGRIEISAVGIYVIVQERLN